MSEGFKLTAEERRALDRIRERLTERGMTVSDQGFILALLRAAAQMPEDELLRTVREGLGSGESGAGPRKD